MPSVFKTLMCAAALTAPLMLSACGPVDVLNRLTPNDSFELSKDISYGDLSAHILDVYTPNESEALGDEPIVMFIYGGGWNSGHKDMYKFVGEAFASNGYTAVIPNYRVYPDVIYPDFAVDAAKAVAWAHAKYNRPIVMIGHSAGAHISALLALDDQYLSAQNVERCSAIAGWIGLAGPYDFKVYDPPYTEIFPLEIRDEMLPINYAANSLTPALITIGTDDTKVNPAQTERMHAALTAAGTPVTAHYYDGLSHTDIIAHMANFFKDKSPTQSDVMDFVKTLPSPTCDE